MNKQKKTMPTVGKYLYGIGGLVAITEVVLFLLFLPWFRASDVDEVALPIAVALGIILPAFLMPQVYAFINGSTAISTGRYHLPMAASGVLASLVFVILLGVGKTNAVAQGFALFGLTFAYSLSMQVFSYTYFSIGQRLDSGGTGHKSRNVFGMLSIIIAAVMMLFMMNGSRNSIRNVVSLAAIIALAACFMVYMATASAMPAFIRVEPHRKRSIKENYARFLAPLGNKAVKVLMTATLLVCTGVSFAAATVPTCVFLPVFDIDKGYKPAVIVMAAVIMLSGVGFAQLARKKGRKTCAAVSVVFAALQFLCAAAVIAAIHLPLNAPVKAAILYAYAAVSGMTLGSVMSGESTAKDFIAEIAVCTPGKYHCLRNCVGAAGFALGLALAGVVNILSANIGEKIAVIVSCAVCSAVILAGAIVSRVGCSERFYVRSNKNVSCKKETAEVGNEK